MNRNILYITLCLSLILYQDGQGQSIVQPNNSKAKIYTNELFRFSVNVPEKWKLYGQIKNDTINHKAIVDWGLPLIYSELEKTMIENSISITAYHRKDINSVDQLISSEYLRINPVETALEVESSKDLNSRIVYSTIKGLKYKGKIYRRVICCSKTR